MPVSQSGSNNVDVDVESPTSELFLQLEPADHHTRQPAAQQASSKAEQIHVDSLHVKSTGSEVVSAQQPSTAAEQMLADAESAQQMTDDQLPTKPPAAATEQGHVDSKPVQNAANEESFIQQVAPADGHVTDAQGLDTISAGAHVSQAPSNAEEQHATAQPGDADLATTKQPAQRHKTGGTTYVPAHDDKPLSPSAPATHQPESSNKAHSNRKPDRVSGEEVGNSSASPTALLLDQQMATSPSFHGLAPAGRDDAQPEDKRDSLDSKQYVMQGTQSDGSKQTSSSINTPMAVAIADGITETPSIDQDGTDGKGGAGLPMNGQGNGHQQMAEPVAKGDVRKSAQSRKLCDEDDSLVDDAVVRAEAGADIAVDNGVSVQTQAVKVNQQDDTATRKNEDACKPAEAGPGQKKKKHRGSKKKKKIKS
ncbi:hypothetical protein WJX77_002514 [Trebouxia sp. C0004]